MAKIFLDTNIFIDLIYRDPDQSFIDQLFGHSSFISPLSVHIYCYMFKIKIPNAILTEQLDSFSLVYLSSTVFNKSVIGPTYDFEDNVQLNSAVEANCDFFLTKDKALLKMGYFGKIKIVSHL